MIEVTRDIRKTFAPVFKVARRDRMRVVWLENDLAYCSRRGKGHDRYLVRFEVSKDGRVSVGCRNVKGAICEGMMFKGLCSHAAKVILRGLAKKKQEREVAA